MEPRLDVITLAVDDLQRALVFYSDGLGLQTTGVVATDLVDEKTGAGGAIVIFKLDCPAFSAALRYLKPQNRAPRAAARIPRFRRNALEQSLVQSRRRESRISRGHGATRRCRERRARGAGATDQQSRTH
jgi:catechol 2,3-dioxygenase-like lactoylglutathione lyase family enzyme